MRGSKPGERRGGRGPGTKNKRTVVREHEFAVAAATITMSLGEYAFEGNAHAFLMALYKDVRQPIELRIEAAKAAISYEKPRLAAVAAKVDRGMSYEALILKAVERVGKTLRQ